VRLGLQAADAEDIGQEVFERVFAALGEFHHHQEGDSFRGWLYRITQNKVRDHHRKRPPGTAGAGGSDSLTRLQQLPAAESGSEDSSVRDREREDRILMRQALKELEAEFEAPTWQAFWRVSALGQAPQDVAQDLGVTRNAVYLAKARVRRRLREEFAGLLDLAAAVPEEAP
jgi:RNA polymerase sigma-70 factor (ECF subfamily)